MKVQKIFGSEICREWGASVKRNPIKDGVARYVTIAKDDVTTTLMKHGNVIGLEKATADGHKKSLLKFLKTGELYKGEMFPDGSSYVTHYAKNVRPRTQGRFALTRKDGSKTFVEYGLDGFSSPQQQKEFFLKRIPSILNPKNEVKLDEIFDSEPKTKIQAFFGGIKDFCTNFFKRYTKKYRALNHFFSDISLKQ